MTVVHSQNVIIRGLAPVVRIEFNNLPVRVDKHLYKCKSK